jgi:hypothetical protein
MCYFNVCVNVANVHTGYASAIVVVLVHMHDVLILS